MIARAALTIGQFRSGVPVIVKIYNRCSLGLDIVLEQANHLSASGCIVVDLDLQLTMDTDVLVCTNQDGV